ncbi:hypothetical protein QW71_17610 [Paenibacillus sp. IHB B 3415]|uniref:extracellular solute-binding protein n=1 Tax=Paenibacillus sp. IHB B 3415 TaxID=867080 RepID=UPI0005730ACA|nr:extracellular solute-binding protein [Paenibacillus sp. IHB B 3415]KHL94502.1 hypothetical protein QW71_17610 [Paenibacillus sp. IHB B 3415]
MKRLMGVQSFGRWKKTGTALLVVLSALTACSNGGDSASTQDQKAGAEGGGPATLSMLLADGGVPFSKDWPTLVELENRTNVKLDVQAVPSDYQSKAKIVLSSDKIPDMVTSVQQPTVLEMSETGVLLPVSDYLDRLPHLKSRIEEFRIEKELDNWRGTDGKLYVFPFMKDYANYNRSPLIRSDLLEQNGLQAPANTDELYTLLKKLKELYPDSYPLTGTSAEDLRTMFGTAWGVDANYKGFIFDEAAGQYEYLFTSDKYKAYLTYLNRLIDEGLADPEMFTSTSDQLMQKVSTGKSFVYFYWNGEHKSAINLLGKENSGPEFEISMLEPIAGPAGKKMLVGDRISNGMVIPASAADKPYFNELLNFIDYLYSDEGIDLLTWGIEGETYTAVNGEKQFTEEMLHKDNLNRALWEIGAANGSYVMLWPYKWFAAVLGDPDFETMTEVANSENWFADVTKVPSLSSAQREEENLIYASVNDYFAKMTEQFVYGTQSIESDWNAYVKEMNSMGVDKLKKMYNDSLHE